MVKSESNLKVLLSSMSPVLHPEIFVFATLSETLRRNLAIQPIMEFREAEGITVVVQENEAKQALLAYQYPCQLITLNIHSDLNAVGFLARISTVLAESGISLNAVSAFYHDHLFVSVENSRAAMKILTEMAV